MATAVQNQREYKQTHETAVAENVSPVETTKQASNSFTSALAEINKRLQNQSKLWACLASGLPLTSANTWQKYDRYTGGNLLSRYVDSQFNLVKKKK